MAADNSAMESILADLLKQAQAQGRDQSAAFAKLAKSAGLDPKIVGSAQARLKNLGDSAEEGADKISRLGRAGQLVGNVLGDLTAGVAATTKNLAMFAAQATSGQSSMSDLLGAFKDLPIVGVVAGMFSALAKQQEQNLDAYRKLSASGINFGDSLSQLRVDATAMGLTLDQYTGVLKTNSDAFSLMGTSANDGAKNFRRINLEMTRSGGVGEQLRNLGYGFEDIANLTASYARVQGGISQQELKDSKKITEAIAEYGKELDFISRLTGRQREQLQKQLEEEMQEANFQAYLSTLDEKERKKLTTQIAEAEAIAGKGGAQIVKAQAMGIAVQGEAGQLITSTAGKLAETLRNNTDRALSTTVSIEEFNRDSSKRMATMSHQAYEAYDRLRVPMGALALQGNKVADTLGPLANNFTKINNQTDKSIEATQERFATEAAAAKQSAEIREKEKAAALEAEDTMREFNKIMTEVGQMLITELLNPLLHMIMPYIPQAADAIKKAVTYLVDNIFTPEGREKILKDLQAWLKDVFSGLIEWVKTGGYTKDVAKQDDANWNKATTWEKIQSAPARGLEKFADMIGLDWLANKARASRTESESEYMKSQGRALGSWGMTSRLFEDFGSGKPLVGHGIEGMFRPQDIESIMNGSAANGAASAIAQLNSTNAEMLRYIKELADTSRRNLDAVKALNNDAFA